MQCINHISDKREIYPNIQAEKISRLIAHGRKTFERGKNKSPGKGRKGPGENKNFVGFAA